MAQAAYGADIVLMTRRALMFTASSHLPQLKPAASALSTPLTSHVFHDTIERFFAAVYACSGIESMSCPFYRESAAERFKMFF